MPPKPCNPIFVKQTKEAGFSLKPLQNFCVHRFGQFAKETKGIFLLHNVGSGKTITSVMIALNSMDWTTNETGATIGESRHIIVVHPTGLYANFHKDILEKFPYITTEGTCETIGGSTRKFTWTYKKQFDGSPGKVFKITSYDYSTLRSQFFPDAAPVTTTAGIESIREFFRNKFVIFDEAHRLFRPINATDPSSPRLIDYYIQNNVLLQAKRVILMSGTPLNAGIEDIARMLCLVNSSVSKDNLIQYSGESAGQEVFQRTVDDFNFGDDDVRAFFTTPNIKTVGVDTATRLRIFFDSCTQYLQSFYIKNDSHPLFWRKSSKLFQTESRALTDARYKVAFDFFSMDRFWAAFSRKSIINPFIEERNRIAAEEIGKTFRLSLAGGGMNRETAKKILGLGNSFNKEEVKKQYRKLALKLHPDKKVKLGDSSNEEFKSLQEAFSVLNKNTEEEIFGQSKLHSDEVFSFIIGTSPDFHAKIQLLKQITSSPEYKKFDDAIPTDYILADLLTTPPEIYANMLREFFNSLSTMDPSVILKIFEMTDPALLKEEVNKDFVKINTLLDEINKVQIETPGKFFINDDDNKITNMKMIEDLPVQKGGAEIPIGAEFIINAIMETTLPNGQTLNTMTVEYGAAILTDLQTSVVAGAAAAAPHLGTASGALAAAGEAAAAGLGVASGAMAAAGEAAAAGLAAAPGALAAAGEAAAAGLGVASGAMAAAGEAAAAGLAAAPGALAAAGDAALVIQDAALPAVNNFLTNAYAQVTSSASGGFSKITSLLSWSWTSFSGLISVLTEDVFKGYVYLVDVITQGAVATWFKTNLLPTLQSSDFVTYASGLVTGASTHITNLIASLTGVAVSSSTVVIALSALVVVIILWNLPRIFKFLKGLVMIIFRTFKYLIWDFRYARRELMYPSVILLNIKNAIREELGIGTTWFEQKTNLFYEELDKVIVDSDREMYNNLEGKGQERMRSLLRIKLEKINAFDPINIQLFCERAKKYVSTIDTTMLPVTDRFNDINKSETDPLPPLPRTVPPCVEEAAPAATTLNFVKRKLGAAHAAEAAQEEIDKIGLKDTNLEVIEQEYNNERLMMPPTAKANYPDKKVEVLYVNYTPEQMIYFSEITDVSNNTPVWPNVVDPILPWYIKNKIKSRATVGNFSRDVMQVVQDIDVAGGNANKNLVIFDKDTNKYKIKLLSSVSLTNDFSCPKFEKLLNHLIFMKSGYMFDSSLPGKIRRQPHLMQVKDGDSPYAGIINMEDPPVLPQFRGANGIKPLNYIAELEETKLPTHGWLPFVYSSSDDIGLNLFGAFLEKRGYKYILLHEDTANDQIVQSTAIKMAYPLLNSADIHDQTKWKETFSQSVEHDGISSLYDVLNGVEPNPATANPGMGGRRKIKEYPICVLLHKFRTEGIDAKHAPAIFLMDSPINYGDYEQLCGRVLRTYSNPGYDKAPVKMVYPFVCHTNETINKLVDDYDGIEANANAITLGDIESLSLFFDKTEELIPSYTILDERYLVEETLPSGHVIEVNPQKEFEHLERKETLNYAAFESIRDKYTYLQKNYTSLSLTAEEYGFFETKDRTASDFPSIEFSKKVRDALDNYKMAKTRIDGGIFSASAYSMKNNEGSRKELENFYNKTLEDFAINCLILKRLYSAMSKFITVTPPTSTTARRIHVNYDVKNEMDIFLKNFKFSREIRLNDASMSDDIKKLREIKTVEFQFRRCITQLIGKKGNPDLDAIIAYKEKVKSTGEKAIAEKRAALISLSPWCNEFFYNRFDDCQIQDKYKIDNALIHKLNYLSCQVYSSTGKNQMITNAKALKKAYNQLGKSIDISEAAAAGAVAAAAAATAARDAIATRLPGRPRAPTAPPVATATAAGAANLTANAALPRGSTVLRPANLIPAAARQATAAEAPPPGEVPLPPNAWGGGSKRRFTIRKRKMGGKKRDSKSRRVQQTLHRR